MSKLQQFADAVAARFSPKITADATWWYQTRCVSSSGCGVRNLRLQQNQCWDSSFCNGWVNTGSCC